MGLLTRKGKANRLTDISVDEISLVEKPANQVSKVVLWKSAAGPPDDDDEGWEIQLEDGTWVDEGDLTDQQIAAVIEAWDDLEEIDEVEESDEVDDDEEEFIEEDEDTDDGIEDEEPLPAMSKLSKSARESSALAKAASEKVFSIVDEMADEVRIGTPLSKAEARIAVLKENPELYSDYRQLREAAVGAVAKGRAVQLSTEALMESVKARAASLSKSAEGKGLTPAQARLKVIREDPEIAKAYRAIQCERVRAS